MGGHRSEAVSKLFQEPLFILLCVRGYTALIMQRAHMQIVPIIHRLFRQSRNLRRPQFSSFETASGRQPSTLNAGFGKMMSAIEKM